MKYMGSKARFAKEILPIILKDRNNRPYVEPFAGGMNMICEVDANNGQRYANEYNKYIVAMFKAGSEGWVPPETMTIEEYKDIRDNFKSNSGKYSDELIGYTGIAASYCGKWFGGFAGIVNTKSSGIVDYYGQSHRTFIKQCKKLKDVWFCADSYENLILPNNSIIYCDPPYAGTTEYKDKFDNNKFWQWVRENSKYHDIYVSEYLAPEDFTCIWKRETNSALSANGKSGSNKVSVERLFVIK